MNLNKLRLGQEHFSDSRRRCRDLTTLSHALWRYLARLPSLRASPLICRRATVAKAVGVGLEVIEGSTIPAARRRREWASI
jgi:hypothetical protein